TTLEIPAACPVCGGRTELKETEGTAYLYCTNPECPAKQLGAFVQYVSRDAMNIDGLSEATIEKFIAAGIVSSFPDLYHLAEHRDSIVSMEGFGEKSFDNLVEAANRSRHTQLHRLLYGIGIDNVGAATAKLICRHFGYDPDAVSHATAQELAMIEGVGEVIAASVCDYFADPAHMDMWEKLLEEVEPEKPESSSGDQPLAGLSFVVTGSLTHFSRNELKERIESLGGKLTGSVTGNTRCLINNDAASNSTKNVTARKLGVDVLTEEEFMAQYLVSE
ncbi:MAG: NAD-dependent DNA ligase LigA, partial [Clostridiales bacterium]|nr:NAD-dependent DNA ligase LigA [Clostridiales bacterium]